jgi:hypothetical protein
MTGPATAGVTRVLNHVHRARLPTNSTPCWLANDRKLPPETRADIGVLQARPQQIRTVLREDALKTAGNAQLSAAASLDDHPLIVLAAGETVKTTRSGDQRSSIWPDSPPMRSSLSSTAAIITSTGIGQRW